MRIIIVVISECLLMTFQNFLSKPTHLCISPWNPLQVVQAHHFMEGLRDKTKTDQEKQAWLVCVICTSAFQVILFNHRTHRRTRF